MLDAVEIAQAARDPAPAIPVVAVARVPGGPEVVELEEVVVTGYRRSKSGNDILQHAVAGGLAGLEAVTQLEAKSPWLAGGAYAVTKTLMKGGPVGALAKKLTMHALDTVAQGLQAQLSNRAQVATEKLVADMAERHEWSVNLELGGLDATLGARELGMAAGQLSAGVVDMFFDAGLKQIAGRGKNVRGIVENNKQTGQITNGAAEGLGFARSRLQHGFKHAKDFGVSGNANNKTLSEFRSALQSHVDAAGTRAIQGTYRGSPVTHHLDPGTGLNVIRDSSGNFLSGWKLSPQQLQHVLTTGKLGGG